MSESEQPKKVVHVKDLNTAVKMKRVQAQSDLAARKAEAKAREQEARLEVQRLKLGMTAREAASRHLAHFAGLYMFLCVVAFLIAITSLPGDHVAVVAGLITLVVTTVGGLLRSIVTEGRDKQERETEE
jgi:uncharacterized membrane-anchored protein